MEKIPMSAESMNWQTIKAYVLGYISKIDKKQNSCCMGYIKILVAMIFAVQE